MRGSYFATTNQVLERMKIFEIFWDPYNFNIRFSNHSEIATCGKLQYLFGEKCFAFLGSKYLTSPYIIEEETQGKDIGLKLSQKILVWFYERVGREYVLQRIKCAQNLSPLPILGRIRGRTLSWIQK